MTKRKITLSQIAVGAVTGLILIVVGVVGSLISSWVDLPERPPFKIVSSSHDNALVLTANRKHERRQIPARIARASAYSQSNSIALAPTRSSFREANGTTIAVSGLACMLQFVPRSVFEAKLCKGGK